MIDQASQLALEQLDKHLEEFGSIERMPTLSLFPDQFPTCACGHSRLKHRMIGTQRLGCYASKKCQCTEFCSTSAKKG